MTITVGMHVTLGEAFTVLRHRRKYNVRQAASKAGISNTVVMNIEGDEKTVKLGDIIALAAAYGLYLYVGLASQEPRLLGMENEKDKETDDEQ